MLFARAVRTWKLDIFLRRPVSGTHLFGSRRLRSTNYWISLEMTS